eukprot:CAMPEP_0116986376 /NCGR_PEP_ID=MMETSP0467-20121206/62836_1 /TAXON_ID=283647 /ORGANISM="Mesodinium pulex, Strain SPMC105" /LENGTH=127 /DNA_ID=CAMNT_0004681917 /DNA_START=1397 /DNA_END=1780 /DNA_ORIENTATION=+
MWKGSKSPQRKIENINVKAKVNSENSCTKEQQDHWTNGSESQSHSNLLVNNLKSKNLQLEKEVGDYRAQLVQLSRMFEKQQQEVDSLKNQVSQKDQDLSIKDSYIIRLKLKLDEVTSIFNGIKNDFN